MHRCQSQKNNNLWISQDSVTCVVRSLFSVGRCLETVSVPASTCARRAAPPPLLCAPAARRSFLLGSFLSESIRRRRHPALPLDPRRASPSLVSPLRTQVEETTFPPNTLTATREEFLAFRLRGCFSTLRRVFFLIGINLSAAEKWKWRCASGGPGWLFRVEMGI